jgi:hypothetical protein
MPSEVGKLPSLAEVRLGELFKGLEKNEHRLNRASTDGRPEKYKTIKALGFTDPEKTAHRFELLASHPDIASLQASDLSL